MTEAKLTAQELAHAIALYLGQQDHTRPHRAIEDEWLARARRMLAAGALYSEADRALYAIRQARDNMRFRNAPPDAGSISEAAIIDLLAVCREGLKAALALADGKQEPAPDLGWVRKRDPGDRETDEGGRP